MMRKNKTLWFLLVVCVLTVIPFLGIYDFNTKGEPRESIVSYTMLESGNWILPRNSVGEIAYKPPMLYWAVAAVSKVCGEVNEFTSRLPSAIAYILLITSVFLFFQRRTKGLLAFVTALVAFTSWELHRQGFNCRVDMILTACIVGAMLLLYRWYERGMRGVPVFAILLMSLGTLTKGPIGTLLPCLVTGVFLLCRRVNFFRVFFSMLLFGLLALILPAFWYYAAWQQGGQEFVDLVMEENVGRMTGTMSYESHSMPWPYNFVTLAVGYLPWTILAVMTLFVVNWKRLFKPADHSSGGQERGNRFSRFADAFRSMDAVDLFSLVAILVIFVFYCFPESKRSVYLMPIYPFVAYFLAKLLFWLRKRHRRLINAFGGFLSVLGLLMVVAFVALQFIPLDASWFHGRHGFQNYSMLLSLQQVGSWWQWLLLAFGTFILVAWWKGKRNVLGLVMLVLAFYLQFDSVYKPAVLNAKSVKAVAAKVEQVAPESEGKLYEFIEEGMMAKGDPIHFFEMNFYLHDRVSDFYKEKPGSGFLMIGADDAKTWLPKFQQEGYRFNEVYDSGEQRVYKQPLLLLKFEK
ncbi:MAG: glycosyltransferase family 39 protein [Prevotella sp.]|nr:glycosyltransferase family 39 protein [Prevotella sp.]